MRLFKRRCSDPNPQLVSLQPLDEVDNEHVEQREQGGLRSGQASPAISGTGACTPVLASPKPTRKGKITFLSQLLQGDACHSISNGCALRDVAFAFLGFRPLALV